MTDSATNPNHAVFSTYRWCYAEGAMVYYRVESYDPAAGRVEISMADDDGHYPEEWLLRDGEWINQAGYVNEPGDVRESEFSGADRCRECGGMFTAVRPDEGYCGCR